MLSLGSKTKLELKNCKQVNLVNYMLNNRGYKLQDYNQFFVCTVEELFRIYKFVFSLNDLL